ncbi:P-type conjugative transfer protein TrbJ [Acidithiobacillus caldus]|uniref:P-type conjugative transfer protein TrbJ n=1 Tax=Acidithiobacillus caldus TaxID=33059 RepID=UPI001C065414|nr:P-type conjugative transfer protein TrbJ [Acidithiobacillus caldus]MBU2770126.1 P-type conjugative transfer protein TrbJ [Acidithiobacillus caldus]
MQKAPKILITAIVTALFPPLALAGGAMTGGATLPEQIVQEGTAVEQLAKQAESVTTQIQQYANMIQRYDNMLQNTLNLPTQLWSSAQGEIDQLIKVASMANGLSYAGQNIYSQFNQTYGKNGIPPLDSSYSQSLQKWTSDTNSQIASILQQYHLNASQFTTEQGALQAVENASQSAVGRMQVLQAANQIAGMEVNQIQQLQQDVMAGNSAIGSYMAQRVSAQEKKQADQDAWIKQNSAEDQQYANDPLAAPPIPISGTTTAP